MSEKVFMTFEDDADVAQKVRVEAAKKAISRSEALRQGARLWLNTLTCPACDGPTFHKDGAIYCSECGLKVAPSNGQE